MNGPKRISSVKTKGVTLGRKSFEKISAVEGLHLSPSMKGTFKNLDKSGASAATRRQTIIKKYGK
jgi:hypothetical protein